MNRDVKESVVAPGRERRSCGCPSLPDATPVQNHQALIEILNERFVDVDWFQTVDSDKLGTFAALLSENMLDHDRCADLCSSSIVVERFELKDQGVELWSAMESPEASQGLPIVMWSGSGSKSETRSNWILQAPHRFFDNHSGDIALAMFGRKDPRNARALFMNTKHRYAQANGEREKKDVNPSDVCHSPDHAFQHLTELLVHDTRPEAIVQIHGFSSRRHEDPGKVRNALAIVSSGNNQASSARARLLVERMRERIGPDILLFPEDTKMLGATRNVQGRFIKESYEEEGAPDWEDSFIHIELSEKLRRRLRIDDGMLESLHESILEAMSM